MQEQRCNNLIKVLFLVLDQLNIEQPLIHLRRPLKKRRVLGRIVQDMNYDKYNDVEQDEEGGHGPELKVGKEAVLNHVEIVLVPLFG